MAVEHSRAGLRIGLALLYILSPAVAIVAFFAGNWFSILDLWSISMLFGIAGYIWFLNQFILAARPAWLDRLYGMDRIYRFHGAMAFVALVAVFVHVILKRYYLPVLTLQSALGALGLAHFMAVILATVLFMVQGRVARIAAVRRLRERTATNQRLQYHRLRRFHNLVAVGAALVLVHVLLAFSTRESFVRIGIMAGWFVVATAFYAWQKVIKPSRAKRKPFRVTDVVRHSPTITTVRLAPPEGHPFVERHKAGQFAWFQFLGGIPGAEEHPFTVSSAPGSATVDITVKNLGNFTARMGEISRGDAVAVDGPYGLFRADRVARERRIVLVAGGIGVTPFLSMIRDMGDAAAARATLLWSVRSPDDIVATDELAGVPTHLWITGDGAAPTLPGSITVHRGRIDPEGDVVARAFTPGSDIFVCGPQPFMDAMVAAARARGLSTSDIHVEAFAM